jgi:type IV secretory pathway TraG/TraD family ATPase VirD4
MSPTRSGRFETTLRGMMTTQHLGKTGVHPVVASAARELLNKRENERSGVLSTAMLFLGLYRDPVLAPVTARCDGRIRDLVEAEHPVTLYLVVPPSDIRRTKPLIRLILNQIGPLLLHNDIERGHEAENDGKKVDRHRFTEISRARVNAQSPDRRVP